MISTKRIVAALQYSEDLKEKREVSSLKYLYENRPETIEEEVNKYIVSHKKETEILIKKVEYLLSDLSSKGMSDRELYRIGCDILEVLEPPNCQKSHCEHHTAYGFCNCREGKVPGKCKDHREYMDRKAKRENKTPGKYFPEPGSRVTLVTWEGDRTGVIGNPEKKSGKWCFPFMMDGKDITMTVCVDEIDSIKNENK